MFAHESPFLFGLHSGAQLRTEMTKIHNYAALDKDRGGTFGVDVFLPFLNDQRKRVLDKNGHPADGMFLGMGIKDPRPLCYKVMSAARLADEGTKSQTYTSVLNSFFDFFIEQWGDKEPSLVNSVVVSLAASSIEVGKSNNATVKVLPEDAEDNSVTWKSSDTGVATVNQKGVITGVSEGNSTITATANDGSGVSGMATISVTAAK